MADVAGVASSTLTDDWCAHHFDPLSPVLGSKLDETMSRMREKHPVAYSDTYGGFWVFSRYADVLQVTQDWETFSAEHSLTVPETTPFVRILPHEVDPPVHRKYRKLINPYFTPAAVGEWDKATRAIANRLIDKFIDSGHCEFMSEFAEPFPGLTLFDQVLHAPSDEIEWLTETAMVTSKPSNPDSKDAWRAMHDWINDLLESRRRGDIRGDVVDGIVGAEIDGRPIRREQAIGMLVSLITGGLETTTGALGMAMLRFCGEPEIFSLLRNRPEVIPEAIEELLRLDTPFPHLCRTATRDTEIGGHLIKEGEKVLVSWASANRDASEFPDPERFDAARLAKRHLTFGAGPHRCLGSNLARMNLKIAIEQLVRRFEHFQLRDESQSIPFYMAYNRTPLTVPIVFSTSSD
jgi:cytochrome P450